MLLSSRVQIARACAASMLAPAALAWSGSATSPPRFSPSNMKDKREEKKREFQKKKNARTPSLWQRRDCADEYIHAILIISLGYQQSYCGFYEGTWHPDKTSCSEVDCLGSTCGLIDFVNPDKPDHWFRFYLPLFQSMGIVHLFLIIIFQFNVATSIEKVREPTGCTIALPAHVFPFPLPFPYYF